MDKFVKINDALLEKLYGRDGDSINNYLADDVKWQRYRDVCNYAYGYDLELQDCESPIEQLLSVALYRIGIYGMKLFNPDIDVIDVLKQEKIEGTKYRADFLIPVWYYKMNVGKSFVIECDGHAFHEKTKEQVTAGNERDRELQARGYIVLHFSGSEIAKSSYNCACKIIKIIRDYKVGGA